ncbi:Armadillo-type fold domain containing protein [Dorcoceras hygrometricum]|uniref:Armadillo-type fold domain containing protein n=1 Tax=Dorcoceras hygrometricum TaxID=472368 RepID=A0A2Z7BFD9_9LAMI|nr:Armadillo-type fold domain containing protein [Dorcoceras hygrometricum]
MGPISYIGPKTSRAARDRPEQNPRKKSAVTISPEHRRAAPATTKNARGAKATHGRDKRGARRWIRQPVAHRPAIITRAALPSAGHRRANSDQPWRTASHRRPASQATSARSLPGQHAAVARPARDQELSIVRQARNGVSHDERRCARTCAWWGGATAHGGGRWPTSKF